MNPFDPKMLPIDKNELKSEIYTESLIDATARLEVYKEKLKDSKLDTRWFLPTLQQKEALASAVLEGTQATIDGVLINQVVPNEKDKNLAEVINYFNASEAGYNILHSRRITIDFIKDIHKILMSGNVRGKNLSIGEFRKQQNYIGKVNAKNAISYTPPKPEKVNELMENLVSYINHPQDKLRPLVRTAIIHAQLETIHPFMDGNGRLGRIFIPLYLYAQQQISEPCFFISEALERDKFKYYSLLNEIRTHNRWGEWIDFFLKAVVTQCGKYIDLVSKINVLYNSDLKHAKELVKNNKIVDVINLMYKFPVITAKTLTDHTDIPQASAIRYLNTLTEHKILFVDEKSRNRNFYYYGLLNILRE